MANEIKMEVYLEFDDGGGMEAVKCQPGVVNVDVTGGDYVYRKQNIGTSAENLAQGEIGTPGYMIAHNLDGANYVEIGYDDSGFKPTVRLNAGEWALFRHTQATPQAKADTSACDIEYLLVED